MTPASRATSRAFKAAPGFAFIISRSRSMKWSGGMLTTKRLAPPPAASLANAIWSVRSTSLCSRPDGTTPAAMTTLSVSRRQLSLVFQARWTLSFMGLTSSRSATSKSRLVRPIDVRLSAASLPLLDRRERRTTRVSWQLGGRAGGAAYGGEPTVSPHEFGSSSTSGRIEATAINSRSQSPRTRRNTSIGFPSPHPMDSTCLGARTSNRYDGPSRTT